MEEKDHLKEILANIDQLHEPVELQGIILNVIQKEESSRAKIAQYKARGFKALILSGILIIVLVVLFSMPNSVRSLEYSIITYSSMILVLVVLFIQLETGSTKIFNNLKNNLS